MFLKLLDCQIHYFNLFKCLLTAFNFIDSLIRKHMEMQYYLLIHFYSLNSVYLDLLDAFKLFLASNYFLILYLVLNYLDLFCNFFMCYFLIIMSEYYCSLFFFHPLFELMIEYLKINQLCNQMQLLWLDRLIWISLIVTN